MNCAEFAQLVHDLDRPGSKGYEQREATLNHAESCGNCGVLLIENESLDFALSRIASEAVREVVSSRLESALVREFRREKTQAAKQRMKWQAAMIGAAAAVFLALGLWLQHFGFPMKNAAPSSLAVTAQNNGAVASPSWGETQPAESRTETSATMADLADEAGLDTAQGFTPLPYADDPSMIEGGSVVRVILSRSALASFGVPLTGVESADQIPADLVVSQDGTPEAIRLVAQND